MIDRIPRDIEASRRLADIPPALGNHQGNVNLHYVSEPFQIRVRLAGLQRPKAQDRRPDVAVPTHASSLAIILLFQDQHHASRNG